MQAAGFANQVAYFGQKKFLLRRRERHRRIERGDADDGAVEIVERLFVDDGGDLSRQASGAGVLVKDDDRVSLLDGRGDSIAIERRDGAQIENFEFDAFLAQ